MGFQYSTLNIESGFPVDEARERLASKVIKAMEAEPKLEHWVLWVDDDMGPFGNCLLPLYHAMQQHLDIDVISALCSRKIRNDYGVCSRPEDDLQALPGVDYEPGDLFEVSHVGLAFTLHRASLFLGISEPRFEWSSDMGEDKYFSLLLRRTGKHLAVHTGVIVAHIDTVTGEHFVPTQGPPRARPRPEHPLVFLDNHLP